MFSQTRLVRCIGTEADNIRPAQRALQMFKNIAVLNLIMGSTGEGGSDGTTVTVSVVTAESAKAEADVNSGSTSTPLTTAAATESLNWLLPALFRGGTLSWNPTVNKMTALALNNLEVRTIELCKIVVGNFD